jgi:DNA-binding response OmpR family regulator
MQATDRHPHTILLVEDDPNVSSMLAERLQVRGYAVWCAGSAYEAEILADQVQPDLVIIDLMLPDVNGLVLCADLKQKRATPVIICSGTNRKDDPVLGFKLGADDFVAKPFSTDELIARIEVSLRRAALGKAVPSLVEETVQRVGELVIDQARREAMLGSRRLALTPTEYRLLCALASRPGHVISREELAKQVWAGYDADIDCALSVHMRRLRAKLHGGPIAAPALVTLRGFGYQLAQSHDGQRAIAGA